jgi:hypothetical protein
LVGRFHIYTNLSNHIFVGSFDPPLVVLGKAILFQATEEGLAMRSFHGLVWLKRSWTSAGKCWQILEHITFMEIYGNGDIFCDKIAGVQRHGAIFAPNLPLDQDLVLKTPMVTTGDPS